MHLKADMEFWNSVISQNNINHMRVYPQILHISINFLDKIFDFLSSLTNCYASIWSKITTQLEHATCTYTLSQVNHILSKNTLSKRALNLKFLASWVECIEFLKKIFRFLSIILNILGQMSPSCCSIPFLFCCILFISLFRMHSNIVIIDLYLASMM